MSDDNLLVPVYLELFGIPLLMIMWVLYRAFVARRPKNEVYNDLGLTVFVSAVWVGVYFFLLQD